MGKSHFHCCRRQRPTLCPDLFPALKVVKEIRTFGIVLLVPVDLDPAWLDFVVRTDDRADVPPLIAQTDRLPNGDALLCHLPSSVGGSGYDNPAECLWLRYGVT